MANWILKTILKFVSYETLVGVIAQALAYLMEYARKHSTQDGWERVKKTVKSIRVWITLFDEVYEDDTISPEEEKKVQEAIANCTTTTTIYNLIQGKLSERKPRKGQEHKSVGKPNLKPSRRKQGVKKPTAEK